MWLPRSRARLCDNVLLKDEGLLQMLDLIEKFFPLVILSISLLASVVGTLFAIGYRGDAALSSENNSTKDTRSFAHNAWW